MVHGQRQCEDCDMLARQLSTSERELVKVKRQLTEAVQLLGRWKTIHDQEVRTSTMLWHATTSFFAKNESV